MAARSGGMDLASYLQVLPAEQLDGLYDNPWTCRALLRALLPLARLYAMRLLLTSEGVPRELVESWASKLGQQKHRASVSQLRQLQLLRSTASGALQLHPGFQQQLQDAVGGGGLPREEETPAEVTAVEPSAEELEAFVVAQWEGLLLYVAKAAGSPPGPPRALGPLNAYELDVDALLQEADLVGHTAEAGRVVSQVGSSFLLLGAYSQLWALLRPFITLQERQGGAELASALSFLLQLGFRGLGRPLQLTALPEDERRIAAALAQMGLLAPFRVDGEAWASPTKLALELAGGSGGNGASATAAGSGTIVVETNYRVYAYTSSPLQTAILRLFVRCECLLPNLFVGTLTRQSVNDALKAGLTAEGIVSYLVLHAHPRVAHRAPVVPEVVSDQIRLWQKEVERVTMLPAYLYSDFESEAVWRGSCDEARSLGAHLWQATPHPARNNQQAFKGALVSQSAVHPEMRAAIKALKQKHGF